MADWVTISSLATAGGTLVLAVATFSSVRSANRSARVAERSLLFGQRPLLVPSREDDLTERVAFGDAVMLNVPGHGGAYLVANGNVYMAIALRNGGNGLAVLQGWRAEPRERTDSRCPPLDEFHAQSRDLYIPAGYTGFWQGAIRDRDDPFYDRVRSAVENRQRLMVDVLYGDLEGGQRTIARFSITDWDDVEGERAEVLRYWEVDRSDPR